MYAEADDGDRIVTYYVVQPWGQDKYRQATILSRHQTPEDAYDEVEFLVRLMAQVYGPRHEFEAHVVDQHRRPVSRSVVN